jgi:hypothetical protein
VAREDGLEQLVYVSASVSRVSSALQMADILSEARPRNARDGITGVLTAIDGRFVQIIEGPQGMLDRLLQDLAKDSRHRLMTVLDRRVIPHRAFAQWDMVSPRLVKVEVDRLAVLLDPPTGRLDAFIAVMREALVRQDDVLNGGETSSSMAREEKSSYSAPKANPEV